MFEKNRLKKEILINDYRNYIIRHGVLLLPETYLEITVDGIYLTYENAGQFKDIILEAVSNIPTFDDIVYEKVNDFSLECLTISEHKITLDYWGDKINSQFAYIFAKEGTKWVDKGFDRG